jgi:PII-like signaling protein
MKGSQLTVFADNQSHRKDHKTVVEWILDQTRQAGIEGATVIEVSESIDVHGKYHAARFFELVDQPVVVTVASDDSLSCRIRGARNERSSERRVMNIEV